MTGEFNGMMVKTEFTCDAHHTWLASPSSVANIKSGCRKCHTAKIRLSAREVRKQIKEISGGNIVMIGVYTGSKVKTEFQCKVCDHTWEIAPEGILYSKSGCRKCSDKAGSVSEAQFIERLRLSHRERITSAGPFNGLMNKADYLCNVCDNKWSTTGISLVGARKHGCPACATHVRNKSSYSKKELIIKGHTFIVQGHEPFAIEELVAEGHRLRSIKFGADVPNISYFRNGKHRKYYPDLFIDKANTMIEVKGLWTMMGSIAVLNTLKAKRKAVVASGYEFDLRVYEKGGKRIAIPDNWYKTKHAELCRILGYKSYYIPRIGSKQCSRD
jgi:rubrerythrin